jgi:hypothetical protein
MIPSRSSTSPKSLNRLEKYMKKKLFAIVIATGLTITGMGIASASTPAPSIKKPAKAAAEGTAAHEAGEGTSVESTEGTGTKTKSTKHLKKVNAPKKAKKM